MSLLDRLLGNGSRPHFEFHAGGLHVIVRPPLVHLAVRPSDTVGNALGLPRMFGGKRAQHVTIPLEPLRYGPHAGKIHVHVTSDDGEHRTIALLDPNEIEAAFARFACALGEYAVKNRRHFTIEELRCAGFGVVLPGEFINELFDTQTKRRRTVVRLNPARIERVAAEVEVFDLEILEELKAANHVSLTDGNGTNLIVGFWPDGDGPDRPSGWYGLAVERLGIDAVMDDFLASLGTPFFDALTSIARELQASIDLRAIERLRIRAAAFGDVTRREPVA